MSKKAYYKCDGCGLRFPEKSLIMNDDLEFVCQECVDDAKCDKRFSNRLMLACAFIAFFFLLVILNHCSK